MHCSFNFARTILSSLSCLPQRTTFNQFNIPNDNNEFMPNNTWFLFQTVLITLFFAPTWALWVHFERFLHIKITKFSTDEWTRWTWRECRKSTSRPLPLLLSPSRYEVARFYTLMDSDVGPIGFLVLLHRSSCIRVLHRHRNNSRLPSQFVNSGLVPTFFASDTEFTADPDATIRSNETLPKSILIT